MMMANDEVVAVFVAPHWGAWIEIEIDVVRTVFYKSHPTGVRGLKSKRWRRPRTVRWVALFLFNRKLRF